MNKINSVMCWPAGLSCEDVEEIGSQESLQYDFGTIRVATDNFSEANKLGQGGFGTVYRVKDFARVLKTSSSF